jgi:hypothetical protein
MGLLTFGGGLHGLGWGSVFGAEGDELRGAVELGAVSGLLGGAVLSLDPNLKGRRLLEVAGGNAMGSVLGGVTVGVFLPELGRTGALASTLAASYAGTAVGVLRQLTRDRASSGAQRGDLSRHRLTRHHPRDGHPEHEPLPCDF